MAFVKAVIIQLHQTRNSSSVVTGIRFVVQMHDSVIPETQNFAYEIVNSEFAGLPAGAAARKTALLAIIKREARKNYDAWVAYVQSRAKPPLARDPLTDLGVTEITSLNGA